MTRRLRVLLSEPIGEAGMQLLEEAADVTISPSTEPTVLVRQVVDADALVVRSTSVPADVLAAGRRLRVVGRHGTGLENIDLDAARRLGIRVVNTPGANAASVAEFVMLGALALSRQLIPACQALKTGILSGSGSLPGAVQRAGLSGRTLAGRSIGIVGFGAVGRHVSVMAAGFGMSIRAYDPFVSDFPDGVQPCDLDELLASSDVVTLHVPLTEQTDGLLNERRLRLLPIGAILVNTARAEVVDSTAVLAALDEARLDGYAVDVFAPEPPPSDGPLLGHPRVLATPHMAAMTDGALAEMARMVAQGVLDALSDQTTEDEDTNP